jgi:hypothetical protein
MTDLAALASLQQQRKPLSLGSGLKLQQPDLLPGLPPAAAGGLRLAAVDVS